MSLTRASLVLVQAVCNHYAFVPPNPTAVRDRYFTEQAHVLQIAPLIFKLHGIILQVCALFEFLKFLSAQSIIPEFALVRSTSTASASPLFCTAIAMCVAGFYIRRECFQALGKLFTFDLTIHQDHELVTSSFYSIVRHPSYAGSIMIVAGIGLSQFTKGSWLAENAIPFLIGGNEIVASVIRLGIVTLWWAWTMSVGISRATAEDLELKKVFGQKWDEYASRVRWWFFPGVL